MSRAQLNQFVFDLQWRLPLTLTKLYQATLAMVFAIPIIHIVDERLWLFKTGVLGLKDLKVKVGDDRSNFQDDLFFHLEAGHFHIYPQQSAG